MPDRLARHYWIRLQRVLRRLARSTGSSHSIALGAAIGFFVGLTPTVGLQMVVAAGIATFFRANRVAAILPVWITNPVTIIPVYSFNYMIGRLLVDGPDVEEFSASFARVKAAHEQPGFVEPIRQALKELWQIGLEIQLPLWLGSVLVGLVAAVVAYFVAFHLVEGFRSRLRRRKELRHERVHAARLAAQSEAEPASTPEPVAPEQGPPAQSRAE